MDSPWNAISMRSRGSLISQSASLPETADAVASVTRSSAVTFSQLFSVQREMTVDHVMEALELGRQVNCQAKVAC